MSLTGNIETFGLSSILQMLNYEKRTGKLSITSGSQANTVHIFLHEGDIIYATETKNHNRLGELLKGCGYISEAVLEECLTLGAKSREKLGKILVHRGHISRKKLNEFLLKQAENAVYNVLLWETGDFEYVNARLNMKGAIEYKLDTMFVLLEASRRIDELAVLKKQIPSESSIPKIADHAGGSENIVFKPDEKRMLGIIDGKSTVRQVFDKSGADDFRAYNIMNSLISAGAIEIRQPETPSALATEVVRQTRSVDSRQIRWALDNLGLQRSSSLRVSLSRIFRDAVDERQVIAAAQKEARKISNSGEKAALDKLRKENHIPYMKAIIELLWQSANEYDKGQKPEAADS